MKLIDLLSVIPDNVKSALRTLKIRGMELLGIKMTLSRDLHTGTSSLKSR